MFEIMTNNFWAVAIIVTCINAVFYKHRSREYIKENPDLAEGYAKLIKGYLVWMNIPWIVMGIGCTVGGVPSVWHFFNPQDGNPYVLAWFGSVFLLWILSVYWIFFKGGAETLVKYPGAIQMHSPMSKGKDITSPAGIKLLLCACLLGGILGVVMMWIQDIPIPK